MKTLTILVSSVCLFAFGLAATGCNRLAEPAANEETTNVNNQPTKGEENSKESNEQIIEVEKKEAPTPNPQHNTR